MIELLLIFTLFAVIYFIARWVDKSEPYVTWDDYICPHCGKDILDSECLFIEGRCHG